MIWCSNIITAANNSYFRTLALLNILRLPFILIPFAIGSWVTGRACASRICKFLRAPELLHSTKKV